MRALRQFCLAFLLIAPACLGAPCIAADALRPTEPGQVLQAWYALILELVRHTPTYSPPVASRAFAYLGVTAYEAVASGSDRLQTLAGQLHGLTTPPRRETGQTYDEAAILEGALAAATKALFANTGPMGQRAMGALEAKMRAGVAIGAAPDVVARSEAYGAGVAAFVAAWADGDGRSAIDNLGFPRTYALGPGPAHWVPTSAIRIQQAPLLPDWGSNRAFAMPDGAACPLPPPPDYSEDKDSEFYKQALEVLATANTLTPERRATAKFWADDAMLSTTPPGHWISIAAQIIERDHLDLEKSADVLVRLEIALADAFIGCWHEKYSYDLVRPSTYIKRVIDPSFEPLLATPPFPEYPSGHSTQSGAAAAVLTKLFGEDFAFDDATGDADGLGPRRFASFWAAAEEAGISRLYGGIHFRAAIERGLDQGRCIGAYANALKTMR